MIDVSDSTVLWQIYFTSIMGSLYACALAAVIIEDKELAANVVGSILITCVIPIVNSVITVMAVTIGIAYGLCMLVEGKKTEE
jgi:hypothetical protein